jgi:chitin disaccharide deacetylase
MMTRAKAPLRLSILQSIQAPAPAGTGVSGTRKVNPNDSGFETRRVVSRGSVKHRILRSVLCSAVTASLFLQVLAQPSGSSLAERLGYSRGDRLLIVHADDVGIAHTVNLATFSAMELGRVTSASIMVPCPWLQEVADYAKANPAADLGLHLTLSSEWHAFKWGPVASKNDVPTLINPLGYFYPIREALTQIDPREAESELRAQIGLARAMGIEPTHLDSHQLLLFLRPDLYQVYLKVGRDTGIPILLSKQIFALIRQRMAGAVPDWESLLRPEDILIDDVLSIPPEAADAGWPAFYRHAIQNLRPGVSQLIVHLGSDDQELRGMAGDSAFGASWRQREFDYLTGSEFGGLLREEKVRLITWREVGRSMLKASD